MCVWQAVFSPPSSVLITPDAAHLAPSAHLPPSSSSTQQLSSSAFNLPITRLLFQPRRPSLAFFLFFIFSERSWSSFLTYHLLPQLTPYVLRFTALWVLLPLILPFAFFGSHTSHCNSSGLCVCVTVRDPKHNTDLFPSKLNNLLTKSRFYTRVKNIIHLVGVVFFSVQYFKASLHLFLISGVNICLSSYIISPLQRIKQTQTTY